MESTLIVYDNNGRIFTQVTGSFEIPEGLQHLIAVIPEGKIISNVGGFGVNVQSEPHSLILEDLPMDPLEELRREVIATQAAIDFIIMNQTGG